MLPSGGSSRAHLGHVLGIKSHGGEPGGWVGLLVAYSSQRGTEVSSWWPPVVRDLHSRKVTKHKSNIAEK